MEWTPEQVSAIEQVVTFINSDKTDGKPSIMSLTGPAGTGKSTCLQALLEQKKLLKTPTWSAMTGKAAVRLHQATGAPVKTLHSTLYVPPQEHEQEGPVFEELQPHHPFLIVDEASMVTPQIYEDLLKWNALGSKILLVGDGFQLPPILTAKEEETHGKSFAVFSKVKGPALSRVMRSDSCIINAATTLRQTGIIPRVSTANYHFKSHPQPPSQAALAYMEDPDDHVLITWRNELRMYTNGLIRIMKGLEGHDLSPGEPIVVRKNGQGALNGERYVVTEVAPGPHFGPVQTSMIKTAEGKNLIVSTAGNRAYMDGMLPYLNTNEWRAFKKDCKFTQPLPITFGYVLTGHMSQGSEFRRVTTFLTKADFASPPFCAMTPLPDGKRAMFAARWSYTAITRAKKQATVILEG